jgi:hypothetical protein
MGLLVVVVGFCDPPDPEKKPPSTVKVTIVAILASETSDKVDCELKCLAEHVQKKHPKLKGFTLGKIVCKSIPVGEKVSIVLIDKQAVEVEVQEGVNKKKCVCLGVRAPCQGEMVYETVCDKFFPIVTRYRTKDKQTLIIAVRAQPCHGK